MTQKTPFSLIYVICWCITVFALHHTISKLWLISALKITELEGNHQDDQVQLLTEKDKADQRKAEMWFDQKTRGGGGRIESVGGSNYFSVPITTSN